MLQSVCNDKQKGGHALPRPIKYLLAYLAMIFCGPYISTSVGKSVITRIKREKERTFNIALEICFDT